VAVQAPQLTVARAVVVLAPGLAVARLGAVRRQVALLQRRRIREQAAPQPRRRPLRRLPHRNHRSLVAPLRARLAPLWFVNPACPPRARAVTVLLRKRFPWAATMTLSPGACARPPSRRRILLCERNYGRNTRTSGRLCRRSDGAAGAAFGAPWEPMAVPAALHSDLGPVFSRFESRRARSLLGLDTRTQMSHTGT